MTTYNTGNPLGSSAAKDLYDNAQNLDYAVNGTENVWIDRLGLARRSMAGINYDANQAMINYGYITKKSFELGATLLTPNTVLQWEDNGEYYRWDGNWSQPKVVPAGSTPETTGGEGKGKWVGVGDASLRSDMSSVKYQFISSTQNFTTNLGKLVYGPGKMTISGIEFTDFILGVDVPNSSVYMNPANYYDDVGDNDDESGKLNLIINVGAKRTGSINRSTFLGTQGSKQIIEVDRCEAFGNGAMEYSKYAERVTAIGSISCQWLGTNTPAADNHQFWSNAGGHIPGQTGWDYDGLETANPGIGNKIAAFNGFATKASDVGRVVGVGRDTFNGTVAGVNLTAAGYRSGAGVYAGSNLSAFGTDALRRGVFLTNSVGIGTFSGINVQEGTGDFFGGYNSGAALVRGNRNTWIGSFSGSDFVDANDCIFIGYGSGNDIIPENSNPSNILAIGNDVTGVGAPLISGNMAVPKVGVNVLPSKIAGTLHIRSSDQVTTPVAPSGAADELILENAGNTGMTIRSGSTGLGVINFSSPTLPSAASVSYNHTTLAMTLRANNADRWVINGTSFNPAADNVYSVGLPSLRPSQIYAGTGSISTSDGDYKEEVLNISEAEQRVAVRLKSLIRRYKFKEAVVNKGDNARYHFGVIAQDVKAAFESEGLVAEDYALLCHDNWEDQYEPIYATRTCKRKVVTPTSDPVTGEVKDVIESIEYEEEYDTGERSLVISAGSRYGIRYDELLCFIIASL